MPVAPTRHGNDGRRAGGEFHLPLFHNPLKSLVRPERFERPTLRFVVRRIYLGPRDAEPVDSIFFNVLCNLMLSHSILDMI